MTLYELTKRYGEGQGEDMMWKTVHIISDAIETETDDHFRQSLIRKVFGVMTDRHYNEELAHEDIKDMFYSNAEGEVYDAPYWPDSAVLGIYETVKNEIPDYNEWDFLVTMNMILSDNWCMLKKWFPGYNDVQLNEKVVDMAVAWLKDEDWPTKTKIWDYLSAR